MGNDRNQSLVRLFGYQDSLSLDERGRFRLPDDLASATHRELGRVQRVAEPEVPLAAYERLSFYFVPGTQQRVFLYPIPNIDLALERFENPPPDIDAEVSEYLTVLAANQYPTIKYESPHPYPGGDVVYSRSIEFFDGYIMKCCGKARPDNSGSNSFFIHKQLPFLTLQ